jgi:hypothetical protein
MPLTITTSGYIEVWREGAFVSRHTVETKAVESALAHSEEWGDGDYEFRFPNKVLMSRLGKTVVPFRWSTVTVSFTQGTAATVNLATFITNLQNRTLTYSALSALPTGVTLSSAGIVSYNGTSPVANASVQFRATSGGFTAEASATTVAITGVVVQPPTNTSPVWVTPAALASVQAGANFSFTLTATDAENNPITFSGTPTVGTLTPGVQSGGTRSVVWAGTAPATGPISVTIDATDVQPLAQVTGLTASASSTTVQLTWTAVTNATFYQVERSLTGTGAWALVSSPTASSYLDTGRTPATTYHYRVRANNATQQGEYSATRSATTIAGSSNWATRSTGAGVVWAHPFTSQAEVDYHLDMANTAVNPSGTAPGGYTLNTATTFGVHHETLNAFRIVTTGTESGYGIRIRALGGRLAADINSTQMSFDITDASQWPDPANVEAAYYFVAIHADATNTQYYPVGATPGSKGWKECVVVRQVTGNTVYLAARGCQYGESASGGGIAAKAFRAGCPVGKDVHGGWGRTFMPLDAASSGKGVADPAAGGTINRRTKAARVKTNDGYYADPYYATHSEFESWPSGDPTGAFDGDDFWIQFRAYIDPERIAADVPGGKFFFIDCHQGGGEQQIVGAGPTEVLLTGLPPGYPVRWGAPASLFGNFGAEDYGPDGILQPFTNADGSISSLAPGVCQTSNLSGCYPWPLGEWFTCKVHVRPGYTKDSPCPLPSANAGLDTADALVVDDTYFTPVNNGTTIQFETTLPPLFQYLPNTTNPGLDGGTFNRHSPGYFTGGGWQFDWPTGGTWPAAASQFEGGTGRPAVCSACTIETHAGGVQRMLWTFVRKGTSLLPAGTPAAGHKMQMDVFDHDLAFPADYRRHELDMWIKRAGQAPVQVYGIKDYMVVFGTGDNKFSENPPAYSEFKPTAYGNVWDNLAPHPTCTFYDFGDIIFSTSDIPWPTD